MRLRDEVCNWMGFVCCESAFLIMPDELIERCICQALGESD